MQLNHHFPVLTSGVALKKLCFFIVALIIVGIKLMQTINIGGNFVLSIFTYGCILVVLSGVIVSFSPEVRVGRLLAFFTLVGTMSLLSAKVGINDPSYQRLAFFVLMLMILSPIVVSDSLSELRLMMWRLLMGGLRLIIIISFIMYLSWETTRTNQFVFRGCVGHGMQLGVIGAIVTLDGMWHLLCRSEARRIKALSFGIITAMAIIVTIATGSRGAILATAVGVIPLIWYIRHNRAKMIWLAVSLVVLVISMAFTSFRSFDGVKTKTELSTQYGSLTLSRNYLWNARLQEFAERPLLGIGFGKTTSRQLPENYKDTPFEKCSTIEPGSSWLNVLASTGIIGFALMLWFNVKLIVRTVKSKTSDNRNLLFLSLLIALLIHGFFEGWLLYAGSITFMTYWLLSSRIISLSDSEAAHNIID